MSKHWPPKATRSAPYTFVNTLQGDRGEWTVVGPGIYGQNTDTFSNDDDGSAYRLARMLNIAYQAGKRAKRRG